MASSSKKVNEDLVNVETLNQPKQVTVDPSKKNTDSERRKVEHLPKLSGQAVAEHPLESDHRALANSDETILIYDTTKFRLFDREFNVVKELEWKEFDSSGLLPVEDLAYLSCENAYLVLTRSYIYQLNVETLEIKVVSAFSKKDKSGDEKIEFASITAHNEHIFVAYSNASAVSKWTWKPSIQLVNRWTKSKVVEENDREILAIRTDGTHVGLLIQGETTRLEVFDFNLATRLVHHLDLSPTATMLVSLANNQWLIVDSEQHQILLVNDENQIEKQETKESSPINASRLADDHLLIKCRQPNKLQLFDLNFIWLTFARINWQKELFRVFDLDLSVFRFDFGEWGFDG